MTDKLIDDLRIASHDVSIIFAQKYYPDNWDECFWVADNPLGVFCTADDFWGIDDMVTALEADMIPDDLHEWYYSHDDNYERPVNLNNFIKLKQQ